MDSSFKISTPTRPSKRLLFDRRYGFVFDEWKEPSEIALAGGRGKFCIVPLGKSSLERASELVNSTASCIITVLQKPDRLSPQILQATLTNHFHNFAAALRKPESYFLGLSRILPIQPRYGPSHSLTEHTESKTDQ